MDELQAAGFLAKFKVQNEFHDHHQIAAKRC
jgi:hypothetical protein